MWDWGRKANELLKAAVDPEKKGDLVKAQKLRVETSRIRAEHPPVSEEIEPSNLDKRLKRVEEQLGLEGSRQGGPRVLPARKEGFPRDALLLEGQRPS